MPRGRKTAVTLHLTPTERDTLQAWQRSSTIRAGLARRGRLILLVAEGIPIAHIAETVGISRRFVYKWVQRFQDQGMEGLRDKPGRGSRPQTRDLQAAPQTKDLSANGSQGHQERPPPMRATGRQPPGSLRGDIRRHTAAR